MALHEVQLKGYSVRPGNLSLGTFDSYGIEQLHVTLDDTWSGLAVTATFNQPEGEPVEIRVPGNGLVDVPAEATANEGTGTIVYCGVANGVQRISKTQGYNVITHGNVGTTVPFNPSESLATQVLQAALNAEKNSAEAKSVADGLRNDAANGKFDGKDGAKGDKGDDGTTPQLKIGEDNLWHVSYDNGATWVSLGVKATGADGTTPRIGENGNWWIGDTDTGVSAKGIKGDPGPQGPPGEIPEDYPQIRKDVSRLKEDTAKLKDGKISKFYASSQGDTNLPDSDDGRIMDLKLYGKSEQKQYSGKNLLNLRSAPGGFGEGVTYTPNGDGSYTRKGTATGANGNVWFSGAYGGTTPLFTLKAGTYTVKDCTFFNGTNIFDNTFTIKDDLPITGVRNLWQATGESYDDVVYPRLMAGSTDTGWEPYVGGIPSPNPEYPQEIKSVVNPVVKVIGKNLWDMHQALTIGNVTIDGTKYVATANTMQIDVTPESIAARPIKIFGGEACTLSLKTTVSLGKGRFCCIKYSDGTRYNFPFENSNSVVFTPEKDVSHIGLVIYETSNGDTVWDVQLEKGSTATDYEPYTEKTATLPYTLNAIPVTSGGNVTIDGQQYVADYVDVERGKLVRMVDSSKLDTSQSIIDKTDWLLATPTETDLTADEIAAFKSLVSYYPVTNVSTTSDQLDGYTVFNYPISLANGWNYVKQQLGDTRDYLYGIDLMTAEAYVNSEYAAALAEIEV